ncbi:hypothetical protein VYU27_002264 [Nannochloropsis oceanica]
MYDRNLQHFSPEGRIYQVQYAERAARRGSPVVALSNGRDALALCVERRRASALEDDFMISQEKVGEIQEGAYLGFAGLAADGRRLLDRTRLFAENYRLKHAELPVVKDMALFVGDLQHHNTFVRAHRPYGVSCVLVGMSSNIIIPTISPCKRASGPCIFATEPSGAVQEYRAVCVGENAETITIRLEAHAADLPGMNVGQLARFAARVLWDARAARAEAAGDGWEREEGKEGEGKVELEVLLLTWEGVEERKEDGGRGAQGKGKVRTRRLFVKSIQDIEALGRLLHLRKKVVEGTQTEGMEEGGRTKKGL